MNYKILNRRKVSFVLWLLLLFVQSYAQNITVVSFQKMENDLTARTLRVNDQNGDPCALIKVVVEGNEFKFEGDGNGIVKTEHKTGEYYVYVPWGSKHLTVKHNDLGVLRQYAYPEKIEKLTTYELKLTTGKIVQDGNYLIVSVLPTNATVYIDGDIIDKDITPFLKIGTHSYKVICDNYVTKEGTLSISKSEKTKLEISLERSHGYVNVNYKPDGATIYVDGKQTDRTPAKIYLESGWHSIRIAKDKYVEQTQTVTITENCNTNLSGELKKITTGSLFVSSNVAYSSVYIDDKYVGYTGHIYEVTVGTHLIKISHNGYYDVVESVKIKGGETKHIKKDLTMARDQKKENREDRREERRDRREERRNYRYYSKLDYPYKGLRWFVEAGNGLSFSSNSSSYLQSKASTILGYQFLPAINLGLGVGINYYDGQESTEENTTASSFQYMTIPLFLYARWDFFPEEQTWCADAQFGFGIDSDFYYALSLGYRYYHLSFSFGFSSESREYTKQTYYSEYKSYDDLNTWFIKAAIDIGARRDR